MVITVRPRIGAFAGETVSTNSEQRGVFTWERGVELQHTGTGQTPRFSSAGHFAAWLRRHYPV